MLDFRNVNTLWCSVLVQTLVCLGLKKAVICPGSRSTPLTVAFVRHREVATIPILDERSASFFALGLAKRSNLPVALVCSSGTAGANFYPAIVEATETGVPLLVFTADRPPELRHCHAGQTIEQLKLYGSYPNWYVELALPIATLEMLRYLRQNMVQAWTKALYPSKGVVHFNCPYREPLAPITQSEVAKMASEIDESFFAHLSVEPITACSSSSGTIFNLPSKGIIVAGLAQSLESKSYCHAIAALSQKLGYPVLAEALSPLRNHQAINPQLIANYDRILRFPQYVDKLQPEAVVQVGELPTSKKLRQWLQEVDAPRYIIATESDNFDPLHGKTKHLRCSLEKAIDSFNSPGKTESAMAYWQLWQNLERDTRQEIDRYFRSLEDIIEAKAAWIVSQYLPPQTAVFFASSMSVRYGEFFWQPNDSEAIPFFNRGANGIDGTLSTALGIAQASDRPTVMLTGDLALLHDTNGFLIQQHFSRHLTIVLINNNGGGIFEILPISEDENFEEYFATPQNIDFAKLAETYKVKHQLVTSWQQLATAIAQLPSQGIRILEIRTDRAKDAQWLKQHFYQPSKL